MSHAAAPMATTFSLSPRCRHRYGSFGGTIRAGSRILLSRADDGLGNLSSMWRDRGDSAYGNESWTDGRYGKPPLRIRERRNIEAALYGLPAPSRDGVPTRNEILSVPCSWTRFLGGQEVESGRVHDVARRRTRAASTAQMIAHVGSSLSRHRHRARRRLRDAAQLAAATPTAPPDDRRRSLSSSPVDAATRRDDFVRRLANSDPSGWRTGPGSLPRAVSVLKARPRAHTRCVAGTGIAMSLGRLRQAPSRSRFSQTPRAHLALSRRMRFRRWDKAATPSEHKPFRKPEGMSSSWLYSREPALPQEAGRPPRGRCDAGRYRRRGRVSSPASARRLNIDADDGFEDRPCEGSPCHNETRYGAAQT